jgi:quinol monooxygenase YgiN
LHRAFINQDLIFALLRVEPRTPTSSFFFKGQGELSSGTYGEMVFEYFGEVHIPYPKGFLFPDQNMATGYAVVDGGALDPYLWLWAIRHGDGPATDTVIDAKQLLSSRGEVFSFNFAKTGGDSENQVRFEYENHSQQGKFKMHSLAWIDAGKSMVGDELFSSYTFSGFGVWEKNGFEWTAQVAAQISTSRSVSYIGIQVGPGGEISNANAISPAGSFPVPLKAAIGSGLGAASSIKQENATIPANQQSADTQIKKEPTSMVSHIIELTAKPGQAELLVAAIHNRAIPEVIQHAAGFVDQIVLVSATDPEHVSAISFWTSKESGDQFFQNGFKEVSAITAPFLSAKPEAYEFIVVASTNDRIRASNEKV